MKILRGIIKEKISKVSKYPLTIITAPMGYGKTTAIKLMSEGLAGKSEWYDENEPVWKPREVYDEETWVVLDNYHLIAEREKYYEELEGIVRKEIPNLHIILITRCVPDLGIEELRLKKLCQVIKERELRFSIGEVKTYFEGNGIRLEEEELKKVMKCIEGWPVALSIMVENYRQHRDIYHKYTFYEFLKEGIYKTYSSEYQKLLIFLARVGEVDWRKIEKLEEYDRIRKAILKLEKENALLKYSLSRGCYRIVPIFADFLRDQFELLNREERQKIDEIIGEWYLKQGKWSDAFEYLVKGNRIESILQWLDSGEVKGDINKEELVKLLPNIKEELRQKYPLGYLHIAYYTLFKMPIVKAGEYLDELEKYYHQENKLAPEQKRRIQGEIYAIRAVILGESLDKIGEYLVKAKEYLDGHCTIAKMIDLLDKQRMHFSHFYQFEVGQYRNTLFKMIEEVKQYRVFETGSYIECKYLMYAEYYMYIGEWEKARNYAEKVVCKAEIMGYQELKLYGEVILARVALGRGECKACSHYIEAMQREKAYEDNYLAAIREVRLGYIRSCLGEKQGTMVHLNKHDILSYKAYKEGAIGEYIAYAGLSLVEGEEIQLEVLLDVLKETPFESTRIFKGIYYFIYCSIVEEHIERTQEAQMYLLKALQLAYQDEILLPFIEHLKYIIPILERISIPEDLLSFSKRIYCSRQGEGGIEQESQHKKWGLTSREWQIVKLIQKGLTNKQIATQLFVANVTVAKTTSNIYRKMGVSNRVEMIGMVKG